MVKNKYYYHNFVKVQLERSHLNGNTRGFHPQTQKLEAPYRRSRHSLRVRVHSDNLISLLLW